MEGVSANFMVAAAMAGACVVPALAGQPMPPVDARGRQIDEIIVHCTATPAGRDVTSRDIRRWHLQRGFSDIGYHFVIRLSGEIEVGRPLWIQGAHCLGHNRGSIGVCYVGGCDTSMKPADTRTRAQRKALEELIAWLRRHFPDATVHGHREFAAKACPSFDVKTENYNQ